MPGKVKVRIISGRNLPIMDRSSDTTDAFAEASKELGILNLFLFSQMNIQNLPGSVGSDHL
jgi:hypothetical protein